MLIAYFQSADIIGTNMLPRIVQEKISVLEKYSISHTQTRFDVLHMYPGEIAYPDGFYDSRWFNLVGFNTELMQKRDLGKHDAVFYGSQCRVKATQVYADGAFLIAFEQPITLRSPVYQAVEFV